MSRMNRPTVSPPVKALIRGLVLALLLPALSPGPARGDAMLQLFNVSWNDLIQKMPELAEAGYTSLWLPPPTKGSSGYSVGYDLWDPFDLGDKDQRGTVATRYGTRAELLRAVETAHRFGLRVYFDNIVNHRAFDVPGYNANTPTNLYPGLVPGDFHLRTIAGGFFRNWDGIGNYNDVWQVQNRPLAGLIDIAHEFPNANFGNTEGSTAAKPYFVRQPSNPEYYDFNSAGTRVGFGNVTLADMNANPNAFKEDVGAYLIRSGRWLIDVTKCDGLRLDAVKHVPSYFFGQQSGAGKDQSTAGYVGGAQWQFHLTHGYTDTNLRDSNFDTEQVRTDALIFGEHLGEPPSLGEYSDAGMRLLDNPLRNYLNDVLGNPSATLAGLEQRDGGGLSAPVRVMHAQSHDNDFAGRRELQNAYYFLREGVPVIYSDGYNQSDNCSSCGGAFPRHANAPYLGQFGDNKMPDLAWLHHQLARGGTRPRWGDSDIAAFERYDYREAGSAADQTVVLFIMNDNYGNPGDISFDDGVTQSDAGMPATCYPVVNSRGQGLVVGFPPGSVLAQLADAPGKDRACSRLLVRLATNFKSEAESSKNDPNPVNRKIYVGSQVLAPGGGAIEVKIPSGGYVAYGYQWPEANRTAATDAITLRQGGVAAARLTVLRVDGRNGDNGFNPQYPFKMRGSVDASGNVIGGTHVTNLTYAIDVPIVTNAAFDIVVHTDGSTDNVLVKLDGGVDLNSQMNLGAANTFTRGRLDLRDNKPGAATDYFLGYEDSAFRFRRGPEKFAARSIARDTVRSLGAETYHYTVGSDVTTNSVAGDGYGNDWPEQTCAWVFHDPAANNNFTGQAALRTTFIHFTNSWRYDQSGTNLGTAWTLPAFDDSAWPSGRGVLALETITLPAPTNTVLRLTNAAGVQTTNFYFRTHFNVASNTSSLTLTASNLIDDGAVFYLNGTEVFRYNLPAGAITATTFATNVVEATNFVVFTLPTDLLLAGDNVMAVEVHQATVNSSDVVFGMSLTGTPRQRSFTKASQPVELWVKVGYESQINKCFIYYTADGTNPEGAYGLGRGTAQVVEATFAGDDAADGTIDWWKGTIPAQPGGTLVKYKIALHKNNAGTIGDFADSKRYALTEFAITNWNPATAAVWLHNDLATNLTATGLAEGFHIIRARAFLPRSGKSSVGNTFLQTFYYDAQPPDGVIAFPAENATLGSQQYGVVVRADASTTEVEYNISDSNPANDDLVTGLNNGNGTNGSGPIFVKATAVSPGGSLTAQYPGLPQEHRFNYVAVPSSGTATITVRLKEVTTAVLTNRFRTLTRTVNTLAPPQTLEVAFPAESQTLSGDQGSTYTLVFRFSDVLTADLNLFQVYIDGAFQPRLKADGSPNYRFDDQTGGDGKNELRCDWTGMAHGSHVIEVRFNGDGLALEAQRFVVVNITGATANIIQPPGADALGRSPYQIAFPSQSGVPLANRFTITTETLSSATNVLISFSPATNAFTGGLATRDTNFVGNTRRWDFVWTNMVPGTFTIRADVQGGLSNSVFRTADVVFTPLDNFTLLAPAKVGNNFSFGIQTLNGRTYVVEFADTLVNPTWTPLPNVAGDGTLKTVTDSAPGVPQRFYRFRTL